MWKWSIRWFGYTCAEASKFGSDPKERDFYYNKYKFAMEHAQLLEMQLISPAQQYNSRVLICHSCERRNGVRLKQRVQTTHDVFKN